MSINSQLSHADRYNLDKSYIMNVTWYFQDIALTSIITENTTFKWRVLTSLWVGSFLSLNGDYGPQRVQELSLSAASQVIAESLVLINNPVTSHRYIMVISSCGAVEILPVAHLYHLGKDIFKPRILNGYFLMSIIPQDVCND